MRTRLTARARAIAPEVAVKRSETLAYTRYLFYLCTAKTGAITPEFAVSIICIFLLGRVDTLFVVLINQVHDHLHHDILFFRPTLSYHQCEGNKGAVGTGCCCKVRPNT
jgi:hypothetical protein